MNVTGKMYWVSGVLVTLLMFSGGCSKKSVQGSAGVGAGDRSGMELQADAGSADGMPPGEAGFGEEDLQGGKRSPSSAEGLSKSSSESSDQADGDATGSDQVTAARPGGQSGSTEGSESKGSKPSQHAGDEGSRSQEPGRHETGSGGDADEDARLAQKRDDSSGSRARTLGPAGELPRDRLAAPKDTSDRDGAEGTARGDESSDESGGTGSGAGADEPGLGSEGTTALGDAGNAAGENLSSDLPRGAGPPTDSDGPNDGLPGAAGNEPAAMVDNGDTGDSSSSVGGSEGSDDMTAASRGPEGAGPGGAGGGSEDTGTGEGMRPSDASSGEEDVSESMIVAKAPPPDDAARQRLEDMKRERMESGMRDVQDVFFDFDSWRIRKEDQKVLESNAEWLKTHPQVSLTIEGHTDPRGTQAYNLTLGEKRAENIRRYLAELGIDPERIRIVSYGKERLFCHEQNERCYQMNRRGHLVVETP